MVQATPKAFCVLTVEERPPGGGQALPGALRAGFRAKGGGSQVWFQQGPSRSERFQPWQTDSAACRTFGGTSPITHSAAHPSPSFRGRAGRGCQHRRFPRLACFQPCQTDSAACRTLGGEPAPTPTPPHCASLSRLQGRGGGGSIADIPVLPDSGNGRPTRKPVELLGEPAPATTPTHFPLPPSGGGQGGGGSIADIPAKSEMRLAGNGAGARWRGWRCNSCRNPRWQRAAPDLGWAQHRLN